MKNWHLPFFRLRIDCLISKSCQLHAKTKQKRNKEASIYAGRVEVVWMVIETASSSRSCMSNGLALDKLNLCAYFGPCIVLYLFLYSSKFALCSQNQSGCMFYTLHCFVLFALDKLNLRAYFTPFFCIFFFRFQTNLLWINSICTHTWKILLFIFPFLYLYFLWTSCDQNQCACKY